MKRRFLCAAGATLIAAVVVRPAYASTLTEARWLGTGTDSIKALTTSPGECLRKDAARDPIVEIGRAAFRSPLLFGGQAGRAGLSCNSCHRDGRDNPAFFVAGLSGRNGDADVTSALLSTKREDGRFNPVTIPDLAGAAAKSSLGTMKPAPSLHAFIGAAVSDEFQGEPPPQRVLDGLVAYVTELDPERCSDKSLRRSPGRDLGDASRALVAAREAAAVKDLPTATFLLASTRRVLGLVFERYAAPELASERAALTLVSREIGRLQSNASMGLDAGQVAMAQTHLHDLKVVLNARRRLSLYDPDVLKRDLEAKD